MEYNMKELTSYHPFKFCLRSNYAKTKTNSTLKINKTRETCQDNANHSNNEEYSQTADRPSVAAHKISNEIDETKNSLMKDEILKATKNGEPIGDNSKSEVFNKNSNITTGTVHKYLRHKSQLSSSKNLTVLDKFNSNENKSSFKKSINVNSTKHFCRTEATYSQALPTASKITYKSSKSVASAPKSIQNKNTAKSPVWKSSPFKTYSTSNATSRHMQTSQFAYDLSHDELKSMDACKRPMKPASEKDLQLLKSGQRKEYLTQRYSLAPECKYNYPEATSWRIGWMHKRN